jgi:hypothetical protein
MKLKNLKNNNTTNLQDSGERILEGLDCKQIYL